mmetsp:Transcript_31562/g.75620  ORF Transcript_31562/g.75620 Transcript_31562/m.75620 type:complete len:205 (-) Transcript_31562:232-846(-)
MVLKLLELSGFISEGTIPLNQLLGPLLHNFLEKDSQLLLPLHPPRDGLLPEILREEGGRKHVGKKPEGDGEREFCEGDNDEEGERDELHAICGGADQQFMLPQSQLLPGEDLGHQPLRNGQVGSHESETGDNPLDKMTQGGPARSIPLLGHPRIIHKSLPQLPARAAELPQFADYSPASVPDLLENLLLPCLGGLFRCRLRFDN